MKIVTYDIENFPNILSLVAYIPHLDQTRTYEVSSRKNEWSKLHKFLYALKEKGYKMVGFNNLGYDYPVLHSILRLPASASAKQVVLTARRKTKEIIATDYFNRNKHVIYGSRQIISQIDLYKIWHFDRKACSLKMLEFVMRQDDIQELPFDPEQRVDEKDIDQLLEYNRFDVKNTYEFWLRSTNMVDLRLKMSEYYGKDLINSSNTAMGSKIMESELEKVLGDDICSYYDNKGVKHINRTKREFIDLSECILPFIDLQSEQFNNIKDYLSSQVITETKGVFTDLPFNEIDKSIDFVSEYNTTKGQKEKLIADWEQYLDLQGSSLLMNADMVALDYKKQLLATLNCKYKGLTYKFGVGGLHASVHNKQYYSDDKYLIIDVDVTSFYPSLAIEHRFYPEHLGEEYCDIYNDIRLRRVEYKKQGSPFNLALKEALNATYGNSNQEFSSFYDPKYTMTTTINGQLSLCMLVEMVYKRTDNVEVIQANTDGVTFYIKRDSISAIEGAIEEWEKVTKLGLERNDYKSMHVSDVNNYIAVYENGGVKRVGAYQYELLKEGAERWEKDHSMLVVPKAVEAYVVHGKCYKEFLREHTDRFDFYLRTKINKTDRLEALDVDFEPIEQQRITRYYVSTDGVMLMKVMPPQGKKSITKKLRDEWKKLGVKWTLEEEGRILKCLKTGKPFTLEEVEDKEVETYKYEEELFKSTDELRLTAIDEMQPRERENNIQKGYLCTIANKAETLKNVNYGFYETEVEKLLLRLGVEL